MKAEIVTACSLGMTPLWAESFYPEDLPEDWQLDYYSNEFSCLYLDSLELLGDEFISALEECISEDFKLFIKVSDELFLSGLRSRLSDNPDIKVVGVDDFLPVEQFPGLSIAEQVDIQENVGDSCRCYHYEQQEMMKPKQHRAMAEFLLANVKHEDEHIYLFFSDSKYSVENSRNFQLLSQML